MNVTTRVALIYALVSVVATGFNISAQVIFIKFYIDVHAVSISVLVGTLIGFPVKYILEKKFVFDFKADNLSHDTRLFILYGFMGVFTTAFFWCIEFAFHHLFGTDAMRYLGGAIGLTIGSYIKYHLDKRYVFKQEQA